MKCADCGKELERDEKALSYKLIGRATVHCYCMDCLGKQFRISKKALYELADHFRNAGCTLFH